MKTIKTLATDGHGQARTDTEQTSATDGHGQAQMNTEQTSLIHGDLTYKIIGFAFDVKKELGLGFLEKVYENAMMVLLRKEGIKAIQQGIVDVYFKGEKVGHYVADIMVDDKVIVEIKCATGIVNEHRAQALNYLKATGLRVAMILNFGPAELSFERVAL